MPSWGEYPGPGSSVRKVSIAQLTENGGAIGGTSDGDLPEYTTPTPAQVRGAIRECATRINEIIDALS